jgi:hypothetical protein
MSKNIILAGNYGSGKTEISINMAISFSKKGRTALVDMDTVNPYFRSAEHGALMESLGISLIAPKYANTGVDLPLIGPEVFSAFGYDYAVFDAGGDPAGASVLGSIAHRVLESGPPDFYYVVNARRPLQRTPEEITEMLRLIQGKARLRITGLINNTNLARETTLNDLMHGRDVCGRVARMTGLPVVFTSGEQKALDAYQKETGENNLLPLVIRTRPDWMDGTV